MPSFRADTNELVIDVAHQNPHALRGAIASLLDHPHELVTVRCGDIGGSFGQKAYTSREELSLCAAARMLGRPVKWVEDRTENLLAAGHARDDVLDVSLAVTNDGTILGARVNMTVNQGAYQPTTVPPSIYLDLVRVLFPNAYRIDNFAFEGTVVASNTATYIAFRGPWESESWTRERMIDLVARELDMEPADVRRRNLITVAEQPRQMATGPTIAHMTAHVAFERACALADIPRFRREQADARRRGRYLGFGMCVFAEAAPGPPDYSAALGAGSSSRSAQQARARLELDGTVSVFTSQQPHGQGHETTLAQLAADGLGIPVEHDSGRAWTHGDDALQRGREPAEAAPRPSRAVRSWVRWPRCASRSSTPSPNSHELDPRDVERRRRAGARAGRPGVGVGSGPGRSRNRRRLGGDRRLRHPRRRLDRRRALLLGGGRRRHRPRATSPATSWSRIADR